ncbi:WD40 repeat-like protein [Obba rivulosa]|uniref:WD40 repeat-like protein n=1 Tax=Obba rivulosa TaxID=1052685 RepID=A0A8E2DIM8_9APHY|nr:WD40 repeat-like protein [Obba rivulosa]
MAIQHGRSPPRSPTSSEPSSPDLSDLSAMSAAEDIYVQTLFPLGYGYPIWNPDPTPTSPEIHIGDVGHMEQGTFYRLFNAMKDVHDPENEKRMLPTNFEKLTLPDQLNIVTPRAIQAGAVCSKTVKVRNIGTQIYGGSGLAQGGFSVERYKEQGAVLILEDDANRTAVHANRLMPKYMREHYQEWDQLVKDQIGLELEVDKLFFVCGYIKSKAWAIMTFDKASSSYSGSVDVGYGPTGIALNMTWKDERYAPTLTRTGPLRSVPYSDRLAITDSTPTSSRSLFYDAPYNQCIFLNYYKIKPRRWFGPKVIKAAAEPRDSSADASDGEDDQAATVRLASGQVVEGDIVQESQSLQPKDPVDDVLDYILEYSDAEVAVASDADVFVLCKGHDFPTNFPEFLRTALPSVGLEDGLGTLVLPGETPAFSTNDMDSPLQCVESYAPAPAWFPAPTGSREHDDGSHSSTLRSLAEYHMDVDIHEPGHSPAEGDESSLTVPKTGNQGDTAETNPAMGPRTRDARNHTASENVLGVSAIAFSQDSRRVAFAHAEAVITVWDTERESRLSICQGHIDEVQDLAFSPTDYRLASCSFDSNAIIWNYLTGDQHAVLAHDAAVFDVAYSPDGSAVATAAYDSTVCLWYADSGELRASCPGLPIPATQLEYSANGRYVAASAAYKVHVWDAETGAVHVVLDGHAGIIWKFAFNREGDRIVTASEDMTARIWSLETGEELFISREHAGPVWMAQFSLDEGSIHTVSADGTFVTCRVDNDQEGRIRLHIPHVDHETTRISPDGTHITSAGGSKESRSADSHRVAVWDARDGRRVGTLDGHTDVVTKVVFSPDGACVATSSYDGSVRIWNMHDLAA